MTSNTDPFAEFARMLEQTQLPGLDPSAIVEARRKDIDALVAANKALFEGLKAISSRQAEMLRESMQDVQGAEFGAAAYSKALGHVKELAEIARQSQMSAIAGITERAAEHAQEVKNLLQPR
ncbi:phasin family protein [Variovorax sp. Sphag1AA]|uniref:phasin family protein n=1 Tax=Variovorax sp. Sphag1AA TaxID=2587027 RepID=UPI001613D090|nr:phasin family protein [Variovorax sp. Sphag1AA]MBB3181948.1 hypothetical protein [Variovorax sp. Sphag1AA]